MILAINPDTPQKRLINRVVECIKQGGVIAYPTDTIYGLGCDIFNRKGIKRIYQMKERSERKPFSFICADLSDVANYAQVSNFAFKIMKRYLPGPYTFVLEATRVVRDPYPFQPHRSCHRPGIGTSIGDYQRQCLRRRALLRSHHYQ
jgi:tRNA threonylcarbamoyl adenosine modification protein (Sua5/YciO/YrdC/YwlC family)